MTVITKKIALKCDTDGCDALAEKQIYLNGEYADPPLQKVRRKTLRRFGGGISFA